MMTGGGGFTTGGGGGGGAGGVGAGAGGGGGFGTTTGGQSFELASLLPQSTTELADCAVENCCVNPAEMVNIPARAIDFM